MYKKWAKVDSCFSLKNQQSDIELFMTQILRRNFFDVVDTAFLAKITVNVQKRLKTVSFGADFLYQENIDHTVKKSSK